VLAILYDIHGNLAALEAVLEDAGEAGAERYVLGGDYALFGPWPYETVLRLKDLHATWIRGNGERWTSCPEGAPDQAMIRAAIAASREELGAMVDELASLPEQYLTAETRFCHGSPISDVKSFLPEPGEDEDRLLANTHEQRLVFGHTHIQFRRLDVGGGIELVNPGSVGMPFDGDQRAAYALVGDGGELELRRVAYDHERSAADVAERFPDFGQTVARRIAQAAFVD
jgi:diadenosine tetraphosphatase ApaH/serine/threonine PP2A family protein phosphatase